jgi:hypothetical protein
MNHAKATAPMIHTALTHPQALRVYKLVDWAR